jgi:gamma-glutamyltranspeptidase/glutathione hydrolase
LNNKFDWKFPYASQRMPILANNIVSTSQPLASEAGIQMIIKGGNAVDAAIATAITLAVVGPTMNGIGSDAFAIIWDGKKIIGLNSSGRSPSAWTPEYFSKRKAMPVTGWDSVTVPGAVSAWVELSKRFGQLPFEDLFEPAIHYAENGFLVAPITAQYWDTFSHMYKKAKFPDFFQTFMPNNRSPRPGELFKLPVQAKTLRIIAKSGGDAFYNGILAENIVAHAKKTGGLMTLEDLANHKATWEKTIEMDFNGFTLHEIPPNGQGLAALIMLGILNNFDLNCYELDSSESIHLQIEAMKLAFADALRYISDPSTLEIDPSYFLSADYLKKRAKKIDLNKAQKYNAGMPKDRDTIYLTTADENGMMVSYIQSNYMGFGSGIVIPDTGISLQNRANGFSLVEGHPNQVGPNKRPYHTIIPAFVTKKGKPIMSFGVMGGPFQPMGHAQMMIRIFQYNQNPQAAIDAPRWRIQQGLRISLEPNFDKRISRILSQKGHIVSEGHYFEFGGAQIIYKLDNGYLGASDWRKDGQAIGF